MQHATSVSPNRRSGERSPDNRKINNARRMVRYYTAWVDECDTRYVMARDNGDFARCRVISNQRADYQRLLNNWTGILMELVA